MRAQNLQISIDSVDVYIRAANIKEGKRIVDSLDLLFQKNDTFPLDLKFKVKLQKSNLLLLDNQFTQALEYTLIILEETEKSKYIKEQYTAALHIALIYECIGDLSACRAYLDKALNLYHKYKFDNIYSHYCIRTSSYYRFMNNLDSALYFALEAEQYAKKFQVEKDLIDSYLLLGILNAKRDYKLSIHYTLQAKEMYLKNNSYHSVAFMLNNISVIYIRNKEFKKALMYNDSALIYKEKDNYFFNDTYYFYQVRSRIYDSLNLVDSAFENFKIFHNAYIKDLENKEKQEIAKITEQYENQKNKEIIKHKTWQIYFVVSLLFLIIIVTILLLKKTTHINKQNKIIKQQYDTQSKILAQKQVLLSELQHRVKNNLQHVISILEMQKESLHFNTQEELIRSTQNRIHSMALLQTKLNVLDDINKVDLYKYITDLSSIVKESYDNGQKNIILNISSNIDLITIQDALPLGLIIVELLSNSIKHAFNFNNQKNGTIKIEFLKGSTIQNNKIIYIDDGKGFDINSNVSTGLGLEIIKGLIDQVNGTFEQIESQKGFSIVIYFKSVVYGA